MAMNSQTKNKKMLSKKVAVFFVIFNVLFLTIWSFCFYHYAGDYAREVFKVLNEYKLTQGSFSYVSSILISLSMFIFLLCLYVVAMSLFLNKRYNISVNGINYDMLMVILKRE